MCYTLRRLANNIQEPFRTLSLQTIDDTIRWWQGKSAPKASALRAPWSLSPNLHTTLTKFLHHWPHKMMAYQVPCHKPSFKMVFTKHALVLDQLCNGHCKAGLKIPWPHVVANTWSKYKNASLNPSDSHWVLSGSLLTQHLPEDMAVIAEGSLLNKERQHLQSAVWSPSMDQTKWTSIHAVEPHHRTDQLFVATTQNRSLLPHHKVIHYILPNPVPRGNLPLRRQTSFVLANLLPMPLLSGSGKHLHGCVDFPNP